MYTRMNLCTAVLPTYSFDESIEIALASGYKGIELRVNEDYHKTLGDLEKEGRFLRSKLHRAGLEIPVLNSYIPLEDERSVDRLISCASTMGVPRARVVLPRSCNASVSRLANAREIIPSYESSEDPHLLMKSLRKALHRLEPKAYKAGVQILLELHWGTVMSSFSSAYFLIQDLDPQCIAVTLDPANMVVEGKEDWEFGIKLLRSHIANVHVKNAVWRMEQGKWVWEWAAFGGGMVDWTHIISLLMKNNYQGEYAMEDFMTPDSERNAAVAHLLDARADFCRIYEACATEYRAAVL